MEISSPWVTSPVGSRNQGGFVNGVCRGQWQGNAHDLLSALLTIEQGQGRVRTVRWGPRTLDLDILLFGSMIFDEPGLKIPHPEMHRRLFVLAPLHEIAPSLVIPCWEKTASQLMAAMEPKDRAAQTALKSRWE